MLEIRISHFGKHIPREFDRERPGAQLVIVDIVRMASEIGLERQVDCLGEDILESVIARDRDREPTFVDRETILELNSHPLEEVVVRATADAR